MNGSEEVRSPANGAELEGVRTSEIVHNQELFLNLYHAYTRDLWRYVSIRLGPHNYDLAADIVQETWIRVWQMARTRPNQQITNWRAWLVKVAHFAICEKQRSASYRATVQLPDESHSLRPGAERGVVLPSQPDHSLLEVEKRDSAAVIRECLYQLPEPYRDVIVARFFLEESIAEIAERYGLPGNTIKSRLHRALAMLRQSLAVKAPAESSSLCRADHLADKVSE